MIGWRGRIGKVCPAVWNLSPEYEPLLHDGVVIFAYTLALERIIPQEMARIFSGYLQEAKVLAAQECDVFLVAGVAPQTYISYDRTLEMLRQITEPTGIPAISGLKNSLDDFRVTGRSFGRETGCS